MYDRDTLPKLTAALADRYRIERELGAGGMATVHLAEDVKHHRRVAIKVLHAELSAVLGPERFLKEIELTANLQHPHILPLFDSGSADGLLYYVMPFVEGETLRARLARETQLPVADAVRIATEVSAALDYAHRRGVVHRDIKPENILLHDGSALVADFGIALAVRSAGGERMTQTGLSLGTPQYMSPEQAMGEREIGPRSDIYSLGAVTYEMLTGEPPFTGPTAQAIVAKVMTSAPEPVRTSRKTVPPGIEAAVHTALQKLPADRFSSAKDFADALEGRASAAPVATRVALPAASRAGWKTTIRSPLLWGLAPLAVVSLAFAIHEGRAARSVAPASVVRFFVDLPDGYRTALRNTWGPNLAISPDGSTLAFPVIGPHDARQLFVRRMDEEAGRVIPGTDGAYLPAFSPDGVSVMFWAAGRIEKVALSGGAPQVIVESVVPHSVAWSPGGDFIYEVTGSTRLMRVPATGGQPRSAAPLDSARGEVAQYYPVALRNGSHVLYTSRGHGATEDARIGLLDLSTGSARRLDVQGTYALGVLDGRLIYTDQTGATLAIALDLTSGRVNGQPVPLGVNVATTARGSAVAAMSLTGTLAYLGSSQVSKLVLANASGEIPLLTDARRYADPRYSPDGRRVAVAITSGSSSDIWLVDAASGGLTRVTSGGIVNERPEWSADGSRVLFRTNRGTRSALWWQPADGTGPASPLLADDDADYFEGVVTPDGRSLVYQEDSGEPNLFMVALDGSSERAVIANTPANEEQMRVSPDGKWVAYVSFESGGPQVVVKPLPGPGAKVQVSIRGGSEPVWSRDGRRIFYRSEGKFRVADVSVTPDFHVASRTDFMDDLYLPRIVPHANYDVAPEGTRLLVLRGEQQRLMVVHDWAVEVRAKLNGGASQR